MKKVVIFILIFTLIKSNKEEDSESLEDLNLLPDTYDGDPKKDVYEKNLFVMKAFAKLKKLLPFKMMIKMFIFSKKTTEQKLKKMIKPLEENNKDGYKIYLGDKWYNYFMNSKKYRDDFLRAYLVIRRRTAQELYDIEQKKEEKKRKEKEEKEEKKRKEKEEKEEKKRKEIEEKEEKIKKENEEKLKKSEAHKKERILRNNINIKEYI